MDPILLALHNRQAEEAARRKRLAAQAAQAAAARVPVQAAPAAPPPAAPGAPAPPNFAELLAQLAAQAPNRSEDEWKTLLDARVAPFTDAINASSNQARAFNEYNFETKAAANKGLSEGFLSILTGGKTGDAAMAYSKENFGGSYLAGQAMHLAANKLSELTADFDEGDWKITGQYLEAMQEIPGIREELREKLEKSDMDAYTRKVTEATLLMDETWRYWQENRKNFEADRDFAQSEEKIKREVGESAREFAERKRITNEQLAMAKNKLGLDSADDAADNATAAKNAGLRAYELELKYAREGRAAAKDKASIRQADARIKQAKDNLAWQKEKAALEKKQASGSSSGAQQAESKLALSILNDRDTYLGSVPESGLAAKAGKRVGELDYQEAYRRITALAEETMGFRSPAYINTWVRKQLARLGLKDPAARPRQGN